jgi:predicted SAM-dependent methyltransferase
MGGNVNTWLTFGPRTAHADALRVDILPIADVQGDIRALTFADGTFAGVEAAHVLEHLLPEEAVPAVRECWRVLRAGGIFEVAVPDLEACARTLLAGDLRILQNIYSPSAEPAWQHRWGYTYVSLDELIRGAGFGALAWLRPHPSDPHEICLRAHKP